MSSIRKETPLPLLGAAPSLQPTARPAQIQRPQITPGRSPLMELSNAFQTFNAPLSQGIREAAAREDQDAEALGEIAATKAAAEGRMTDIENIIKGQVDAGNVPAFRTPAFARGVSTVVGHNVAQTDLQSALSQALPQMGVLDGQDPVAKAEAIAGQAYNAGLAKVGKDFYAQKAYTEQGGQLIAQFRQAAIATYSASYKAYGEDTLANAGIETAKQLASAPADQLEAMHGAVGQNLDALRKILPTDQVNKFYLDKVVTPAVLSLSAAKHYTEASMLIAQMEGLDVTGKGGLLGKTTEGIMTLDRLRKQVDSDARNVTNNELNAIHDKQAISAMTASGQAAQDILKMRQANGGILPDQAVLQKSVDDFTAKSSDGIAAAAYRDAFTRETDADEKGKADDRQQAALSVRINSTVDPKQLDLIDGQLDHDYASHAIAPSVYAKMKDAVAKSKGLANVFDDTDGRRMQQEVFSQRPEDGSGIGNSRILTFGKVDATGANLSQSIWNDKLSQEQKDRIQADTQQFFLTNSREQLRSLSNGDPAQLSIQKGPAMAEAMIQAKKYAEQAINDAAKVTTKTAVVRAAADQKTVAEQKPINAFALQWRHMDPQVASLDYQMMTKDLMPDSVPGNPIYKTVPARYELPALTPEELTKIQTEYKKGSPPAEQEYFPFRSSPRQLSAADILKPNIIIKGVQNLVESLSRTAVTLPALAKDATENPDPGAAAVASRLYAQARGILGYTSDEVINGVTRHGVPIDASQISPRLTPLFTTMEDMDKHWNDGKPDATFISVWSKTNSKVPAAKISPVNFYKLQRALLSQ